MKEKNILEDYKSYMSLKDHKTYKIYARNIEEFMNYLAKHKIHFKEVVPATIIDYRSCLLTGDKKLSRGTVNNKINYIKSFYTFLFKRQYIFRNPFRHIKSLKKGKFIPKNILSTDDMAKLLSNLSVMSYSDLMLKVMIEFLYGSSMRIAEVEALKESDLDFDNGVVWVTNFKDNGRRWKAPATEVCFRETKAYIKNVREKLLSPKDLEEGWLFPQLEGKTTLRCLLNNKLQRDCKRLGLKLVTSHGFRHSSATHMLKAGAGIRQVQMMLGHQRITSTQSYLRVVKEDLKSVITNHHPREKQEGL